MMSSRLRDFSLFASIASQQSSANSEKAPQIALAGSPRKLTYSRTLKTLDIHKYLPQ